MQEVLDASIPEIARLVSTGQVSAEEVARTRGFYDPQWHYDNEPETRAALDLIGLQVAVGDTRGGEGDDGDGSGRRW